MATAFEPVSRPGAQSRGDAAAACGVLLLLGAGLVWAYLPIKAPPPSRDGGPGHVVSPGAASSSAGEGSSADRRSAEAVGQPDRSVTVPDVRLAPASDSAGFLHGTVYNHTGGSLSRLRLRVTTARWADRAFDVKVNVDNHAAAGFSFFVGEPGLKVEGYRALGPGD